MNKIFFFNSQDEFLKYLKHVEFIFFYIYFSAKARCIDVLKFLLRFNVRDGNILSQSPPRSTPLPGHVKILYFRFIIIKIFIQTTINILYLFFFKNMKVLCEGLLTLNDAE